MSASDIGELVGICLVAWVSGFSGGYLLTRYRDAINEVVR